MRRIECRHRVGSVRVVFVVTVVPACQVGSSAPKGDHMTTSLPTVHPHICRPLQCR